jgi:hypothetical protein
VASVKSVSTCCGLTWRVKGPGILARRLSSTLSNSLCFTAGAMFGCDAAQGRRRSGLAGASSRKDSSAERSGRFSWWVLSLSLSTMTWVQPLSHTATSQKHAARTMLNLDGRFVRAVRWALDPEQLQLHSHNTLACPAHSAHHGSSLRFCRDSRQPSGST